MGPIRYLAALIGAGDQDVLRSFILVVALLLETRRIYRPIPFATCCRSGGVRGPFGAEKADSRCDRDARHHRPSRQGHTGPWGEVQPRLWQCTYIAAPVAL
jgi:hypothetical protein